MGRIDPIVQHREPPLNHDGHSNTVLALFLALTLVRGVLYSVIIPLWQAPDEPQHYQMVRVIGDLDHIPSPHETCRVLEGYQAAATLHKEIVQSLHDNRFWENRHRRPAPQPSDSRSGGEILQEDKLAPGIGHPPVYYILASLVLYPMRSSSISIQLYALRGLSVLLSLITVWCVFMIGNWLSQNRPGQRPATSRTWAAALFVVFLPMHTFMSAAVNNDALAEMLASLALTLVMWCCLQRFSYVHIVILVVLLLLGLFTKRTTLFLLPVVLVFLACQSPNRPMVGATSHRPRGKTAALTHFIRARATSWGAKMILFLVVLLITYILVFDDATQRCWDLPARVSQLTQTDQYVSDTPNQYRIWTLLGFASFWGNFGWMNIPLDVAWYAGLAVLTLAAVFGALRGAWRLWRDRRGKPAESCAVGFCALALFSILGQTGASMIVRQMPPQGRYLFPAMVPIALGFTWGLFDWIPVRYHRFGLIGMAIGLIIFDSASVLGYVLPYFYG